MVAMHEKFKYESGCQENTTVPVLRQDLWTKMQSTGQLVSTDVASIRGVKAH